MLTLEYSLQSGGRDAFVDEIFIDAGHRGLGVGTAALRLAPAACRDLGVRALHLEVARDSTAARRLYRKVGFEEDDSILMTAIIAG